LRFFFQQSLFKRCTHDNQRIFLNTSTKTDDSALGNFRWWERGIIYQVYPRSFMDGNGDGIGDLAGIRQRLDYLDLEWLGVDAIWISPIYPSPMVDFGYDVSKYTDIDPLFGTLEEFDALLADVHARGMKLLLDYVPNHTSDRHPWFIDSRSARSSPRRDWYIWRDPAPGGGPPNNWRSNFGGGAWEWDEKTGQYYYHAFLKEQPDLNWRHPEVQRAMLDVLRFWLDRGVNGFRVDVMHHLVKDIEFRDNPRNPDFRPGMSPYRELLTTHTADLPEVQEIVALMRGVIENYPDRMLVGEIYLPVLNFGAAARRFNLGELQAGASLLLSTYLDHAGEKLREKLQVRGNEGVIVELL
jgi:alpha-glucosidase